MSNKSLFTVLSALLIFVALGCEPDEEPYVPATGDFRITIENVFEPKDYFATGKFFAVDSAETFTFSIDAGPGQHLTLAASLNDLSDLFFATPPNGVPLYDGEDPIVSTDLEIKICDAGTYVDTLFNILDTTFTEIDTIIMGQSTIIVDTMLVVDTIIPTTIPPIAWLDADSIAVEETINVKLEYSGEGTRFDVTIENVSDFASEHTKIGEGVWVLNDEDQEPIFSLGTFPSPDFRNLAQFNTNAGFARTLVDRAGFNSAITPGAFVINDSLFSLNVPASQELEALAEDGDPSGFSNTFEIPDGASAPGPIAFGESYTFEVLGRKDGDFISVGLMLEETNDWFLGVNFIPLFHNNIALSGGLTFNFDVWDAGTETDEYPTLGANQFPRQSGNNTGPSEGAMIIRESDEQYNLPAIDKIIKVTLTAI